MSEIYCPAQTFPGSRYEPKEFCDELVADYGDYCERHDYTDEDAADDAREHNHESRMGY